MKVARDADRGAYLPAKNLSLENVDEGMNPTKSRSVDDGHKNTKNSLSASG